MIKYSVINPVVVIDNNKDYEVLEKYIYSLNTNQHRYDIDRLSDDEVQLIGEFEVNQLQGMFDEVNGL